MGSTFAIFGRCPGGAMRGVDDRHFGAVVFQHLVD
jgi:hypothetical protein